MSINEKFRRDFRFMAEFLPAKLVKRIPDLWSTIHCKEKVMYMKQKQSNQKTDHSISLGFKLLREAEHSVFFFYQEGFETATIVKGDDREWK